MTTFKPETAFCKSSKKILRQSIYVILAYLFISNVRFIFVNEEHYLLHLLSDFFYALFLLITWIIQDYFTTDCVEYNEISFHVKGDNKDSRTSPYKFDEIIKVNYIPYVGILTIKMQGENRYIDLVPSNYRFEEFESFLKYIESYQPISRGFYIPDDGLKTRGGKIFAYTILIFFSSIILLAFYAKLFYD